VSTARLARVWGDYRSSRARRGRWWRACPWRGRRGSRRSSAGGRRPASGGSRSRARRRWWIDDGGWGAMAAWGIFSSIWPWKGSDAHTAKSWNYYPRRFGLNAGGNFTLTDMWATVSFHRRKGPNSPGVFFWFPAGRRDAFSCISMSINQNRVLNTVVPLLILC
jgi:hypothetical protein